jgi:hypothetical protein
MRRTVLSPIVKEWVGSGGMAAIVTAWISGSEPPGYFENAGGKTEAAENDQKPWGRMKPFVEVIADKSANGNGPDKCDGQFHREAYPVCVGRRFAFRGSLVVDLIRLIVQ